MKVCACFLLFGIFANTQSFAYKPEINPKSVNLALKTVFEFHNEDKQSDIKLLDDIQNIIAEIRTIIDKNSNIKNLRSSRDATLTGFIQDAINIINTYENTALEDFIQILDAEIGQYDYKGCKFSELTKNNEIEKLITAKLDSIKSRSIYFKKRNINALSDVLKYENYDGDVKKIVDYINSLYTQAGDKFRRFLSNLVRYGKSKSGSNTNLVMIIKNGLRSIIFDHYTNLSMNTRRYLRHQIENFWQRYKKYHASNGDNVTKVTPYNIKNSKNIINEAKNLEPDSRKYRKNTNDKINQKWIKTKQSQHKYKITTKYDPKNEKKRFKNTRKKNIDESFEIEEKETRQSSQNTDHVDQQWDEIKLQGQTGDVLVDSLSESFDSIELLKGQQDKTQQFIAIIPDKYTQKSTNVTKKSDIIDSLNVTTKTPTHKTTLKKVIWIEQSMGRLPKAVLDKLSNNTSRSNPDLTGRNLNKNGPKHKKNNDQKRWHRKVNKLDKTRKKGYKSKNAKTHEKMFDPQNDKMLRYSELIRDKTNKKKYQQENDKTYGKIYQQAGDRTRENINEPDNDKTPESVYESENDKMHENKDENLWSGENIHDTSYESDQSTEHHFEFDFNYKSQEDTKYKYKKNLNPNEATNIKRYETEHGKTLGKVFKSEYDKTHGEIYKPQQDKMRGNILYDKRKTTSAIENQFIYESKEDKKHKPYDTSKPRKPSIVKHNFRDLSSQHDVRTTNSLFNNKDEEEQELKNTKGLLRVELKHDNRLIRSTTEGLLQVLDVQKLTEPSKTIKHLARKAPAFSRPSRLQLDDRARIKPTYQASPQSNSSIGWLHVQLPLKAYSKNNNKWSKKHDRFSRKSTEYSTSFKEGITAGNIEITDDNKHNAQTTSFGYLKDSFESQMNRGISRANDNTEEGRKAKHRFEVKSYGVKPKQVETMSTLDDTLRQDTSKIADTVDHETDLINYVTDKNSKINDYDVVRGITVENTFRSGVNMIPVDLKVKDKLKTAETAVNKTEFSIEDYKDKYAENNLEYGKKSETGFKSGFEMPPFDNMVRLNVTGAAINETDFIIEHVTQNKLNMTGTAVNKIEHIIENKNIKDKDSINNDIENILNNGITSEIRFKSDLNMIHKDFKNMADKTEVTETTDNIREYKDSIINIENGKMYETNFSSNINMMSNDFNDKTDQTNTRTADIKTEFIEKENDFKSKEDIVDKDHQIYQVDDQTSIIGEEPKEKDQIEKDTKQQYIDNVTFEAKHRDMKDQDDETLTKDSEIKVIMKPQKDQDFLNNYNDYDASKGIETPTTNIATSSSMNGTESTTKVSATTVLPAAFTTPKLTDPVSIPVVISFKAPDVSKKAELNANENKNNTLPDVNIIGEVKSKVDTNATNL